MLPVHFKSGYRSTTLQADRRLFRVFQLSTTHLLWPFLHVPSFLAVRTNFPSELSRSFRLRWYSRGSKRRRYRCGSLPPFET